MISSIHTSALRGMNGQIITVECDSSNSLPSIIIVGMGSKAVDEAKERIRSAIKHSGLTMPIKRLTLNLAPADIAKEGASFDLAMAMAILVQSQQISAEAIKGYSFVAELGLDGSLRPVRGLLGHLLAAREAGLAGVIVPHQHQQQAALVEGIEILPAKKLKDVYRHFNKQVSLSPIKAQKNGPAHFDNTVDVADIRGHEAAKRALQIACIGRHNILLSGPPGTGKSMLAKSLIGLLPGLSNEEALEVTHLHSLSSKPDVILTIRPYRAPHHTASHVAMLGGGKPLRPGEVSLAHNGVLFLDELPEFNRLSLEGLRQPLEDKSINITRVDTKVSYPANFMLVATQNPCPCGYFGDKKVQCTCSPHIIERYRSKLSGPLLDRFDMVLHVDRIEADTLLELNPKDTKTSKDLREEIVPIMEKAALSGTQLSIKDFSSQRLLPQESRQYAKTAATKLNLSPRAYIRTLRVARSISLLEGSGYIQPSHIAEALQYRQKNRSS